MSYSLTIQLSTQKCKIACNQIEKINTRGLQEYLQHLNTQKEHLQSNYSMVGLLQMCLSGDRVANHPPTFQDAQPEWKHVITYIWQYQDNTARQELDPPSAALLALMSSLFFFIHVHHTRPYTEFLRS